MQLLPEASGFCDADLTCCSVMLLQGLNEQRCGGSLSSGEDKQRMESFDEREALSGGVTPSMW